jgi:hypothetical protein
MPVNATSNKAPSKPAKLPLSSANGRAEPKASKAKDPKVVIAKLRSENQALQAAAASSSQTAAEAQERAEMELRETREAHERALQREKALAGKLAEHGIGFSTERADNDHTQAMEHAAALTAKIRNGMQQTQDLIMKQLLLRKSLELTNGQPTLSVG